MPVLMPEPTSSTTHPRLSFVEGPPRCECVSSPNMRQTSSYNFQAVLAKWEEASSIRQHSPTMDSSREGLLPHKPGDDENHPPRTKKRFSALSFTNFASRLRERSRHRSANENTPLTAVKEQDGKQESNTPQVPVVNQTDNNEERPTLATRETARNNENTAPANRSIDRTNRSQPTTSAGGSSQPSMSRHPNYSMPMRGGGLPRSTTTNNLPLPSSSRPPATGQTASCSANNLYRAPVPTQGTRQSQVVRGGEQSRHPGNGFPGNRQASTNDFASSRTGDERVVPREGLPRYSGNGLPGNQQAAPNHFRSSRIGDERGRMRTTQDPRLQHPNDIRHDHAPSPERGRGRQDEMRMPLAPGQVATRSAYDLYGAQGQAPYGVPRGAPHASTPRSVNDRGRDSSRIPAATHTRNSLIVGGQDESGLMLYQRPPSSQRTSSGEGHEEGSEVPAASSMPSPSRPNAPGEQDNSGQPNLNRASPGRANLRRDVGDFRFPPTIPNQSQHRFSRSRTQPNLVAGGPHGGPAFRDSNNRQQRGYGTDSLGATSAGPSNGYLGGVRGGNTSGADTIQAIPTRVAPGLQIGVQDNQELGGGRMQTLYTSGHPIAPIPGQRQRELSQPVPIHPPPRRDSRTNRQVTHRQLMTPLDPSVPQTSWGVVNSSPPLSRSSRFPQGWRGSRGVRMANNLDGINIQLMQPRPLDTIYEDRANEVTSRHRESRSTTQGCSVC